MTRKHLLFLLLVLFLVISLTPASTKAATLTASGNLTDIRKAPKGRGTLKTTRKGKRFLKKNGARTTWTSLNGKWYYFKKNGVLSQYKKSDQVLLIRGSASKAKVYFLEKKSSTVWKLKRRTTGYLGRLGVGTHREGVPNTPSGDYSFGVAFGTKADPGTDFAYTQVDASHYWVDDSSSAYYNQFVSTNEVTADWNSAEHLIDYPAAYAYALSLNYNTKGTAGKGSAIFLHCSTGGPTAGCISVPQKDMVYFLKNLKTDARIIIQKS